MSFDQREYVDAIAARAKEAHALDNRQLRMLKQAAVNAEHVTGDPAWDQMLSFQQEAFNQTMNLRGAYVEKLLDPMLVNSEEIQKLKLAIVRCVARAETLDSIMKLPKEIKEKGVSAGNLLKEEEGAA